MSKLELYGSKTCQYTTELFEELEWQAEVFSYFDVTEDQDALDRMLRLTDGLRNIPVLVKDGTIISIGYKGRSCNL